MRVEHLSAQTDVARILEALDVDAGGRKILASKARLHLIYIRKLHVGAANILKQDALSVGADLAVPKGTIVAKTPTVDALLMETAGGAGAQGAGATVRPQGARKGTQAFRTAKATAGGTDHGRRQCQ